ncbi:hypothetical protein PV327_011468 [Microctonus hyperodae]|uniref:Uncharacterized protein n=1 Tax=Microctonus hyperodae TaxID=165561 RepID=A0AA39C322_MICHY|nr:hypothetical protein PV327_011468 [Microctonus hyperodae]
MLEVEDYNRRHGIADDDEIFRSLSVEDKKAAQEYVRIEIRGKLNSVVPILLGTLTQKSVALIMKHRRDARVHKNNPYVFGLKNSPNSMVFNHLRATDLMRTFSEKCGAENPELLRGTILRKHFATKCSQLEMKESEISRVAQYMGHQRGVHEDVYVQGKRQDILSVSKVLKIAENKATKHTDNCNSNNFAQNTTVETTMNESSMITDGDNTENSYSNIRADHEISDVDGNSSGKSQNISSSSDSSYRSQKKRRPPAKTITLIPVENLKQDGLKMR